MGTVYETFTASGVVLESNQPTVLDVTLIPNVIKNLDVVEIEASEKKALLIQESLEQSILRSH